MRDIRTIHMHSHDDLGRPCVKKGANISQACKRTWTEFSGLGLCGHRFSNCAQLQLFGAGIARELFENRATTR
jgi:hypothetical protein